MAKDGSLSAAGVVTAAFLAQLAGHLLLKQYMPNAAVGALGFLFVGMIFYYVMNIRRDSFGFILVVYICSHFSYADNQGGLWNLMTFGVLAISLIVGRRKELRRRDNVISALLGIFVLWDVVGWAVNAPLPIIPALQGLATFFGFVLMFQLASSIVITKERLRLFLKVVFFMLLYQFIVALNQRYYVVQWRDPFIGGNLEYATTQALGTFQHYELFGEYGVLMACLLVPMLSSSLIQRETGFSNNRFLIMIFCCLSFILFTMNRSSAILLVVAVAIYYLILPMRIFKSVDRPGRQIKLVMALVIVLPLVGAYIGLHSLGEKFGKLSGQQFSFEGILSGKDINRGQLVSAGLTRLQKESWWVGYGFGTPRSNLWAWFGFDPGLYYRGASDYHSLYLSLPELYGWIGALAFLAMIMVTAFRLFNVSWRYREKKSFLLVLTVGFTMFWIVFLADQYKISILRIPNYHMLFWIWLGLSNSILKTIRDEGLTKNAHIPSPVPQERA